MPTLEELEKALIDIEKHYPALGADRASAWCANLREVAGIPKGGLTIAQARKILDLSTKFVVKPLPGGTKRNPLWMIFRMPTLRH